MSIWHWIVAATVLLVLVGGRGWLMGEGRRMASEFRDQFREAMRDSEYPFGLPIREATKAPSSFWPWTIIVILVLVFLVSAWMKYA